MTSADGRSRHCSAPERFRPHNSHQSPHFDLAGQSGKIIAGASVDCVARSPSKRAPLRRCLSGLRKTAESPLHAWPLSPRTFWSKSLGLYSRHCDGFPSRHIFDVLFFKEPNNENINVPHCHGVLTKVSAFRGRTAMRPMLCICAIIEWKAKLPCWLISRPF